jgi:hypothetical protein
LALGAFFTAVYRPMIIKYLLCEAIFGAIFGQYVLGDFRKVCIVRFLDSMYRANFDSMYWAIFCPKRLVMLCCLHQK